MNDSLSPAPVETTTRLPGRPVYIIDGSRSPQLKASGRPGPFRAADLAVQAGRELLIRQPFPAEAFDEVILGCVGPGPDEANIARIAALRLGCGEHTPAYTVQRNCASGMQAVENAALDIASDRAELVLAGGAEAMSHSPVLLAESLVAWLGVWNRARDLGARARQLTQLRPMMLKPVIGLLRGLTDPFTGLNMGQTAEKLAWRFDITREAMDAYATRSHQRLAAAQESGRLDAEITPLFNERGTVWEKDDGVRPDSSIEKLAKLRPVFDRPVGRVTAGNSSQISDGAAWLILASEAVVEKYDLPLLGRLVDSQWGALDPSEMGLGPVFAMAPILQRRGLDSDDIDFWEINEAFAAQVLACLKAWHDDDYCRAQLGRDRGFGVIPDSRLNVDGGGISLGHPVGASGARIILHLLHTLRRSKARRGIASLCIGGGQGGAVLVESIQESR